MKRPLPIVLCLALLAPGGWQSTLAAGTDRDRAAGPQARAVPPARVTTRKSRYGKVLIDGSGRTLYLFDREERARSECYGACARAWPPLLTTRRPVAGGAARGGLLSTTRRRDGSRQVTYAGHPLYAYAHEGPGQILCQNIAEFGGLWLVVRPNGHPVR